MSDDFGKAIKSAELWRDSLIAADSAFVYIAVDCVECLKELQVKSIKVTDVTVRMNENMIWVNSAEKCEVRICGLHNLKGKSDDKAVMAGCGDLIDVMVTGDVEICNECGRSVVFGSGLYVNRIPDFNTPEERKEMGKPHPEGDYMCIECEEKLDEGVTSLIKEGYTETVSVQIDEVIPCLIGIIKDELGELPKGTKFVYTSKTRFLTFDVIRPDWIDEG